MGVLRRASHTGPGIGRRGHRYGVGTRLRALRGVPAWLLWTASLVLVSSLVAGTSLWILTRPSGSPAAAGPQATDSAGAAGAGRASGTVVSLTFNDGTKSQYDFARPLLRRYGVHGTFYVSTDSLDAGEGCCMGWQQVEQLYREGDEIGSFSADHVDLTVPFSPDPAQDYEHKRDQVCRAHERLARLGFDPRSFAYPGGAHAYEFPSLRRSLPDLVASCGYLAGRIVGGLSADGGPSSPSSIPLPPSQPYVVATPAEVSLSPITLADLQHVVLAGAGPGHWVPLVFSEVCHSEDPSYALCMSTRRPIDDTVLSAFLSWLTRAGEPDGAPAGTVVQTVRQVMGAPPQPPLAAPRTFVSLTFDDGDVTQELAGRLLRAHGMQGTFYVNTGPIDAKDPSYLTWSQVLSLHRDGNDIGGHTADHVDLTDPQLPESVKRDETCRDRTRLLQMGLDPQNFAYPFGALDPAVKQLVESCGYRSGRSAGSVSLDGPVFAETVPPGDPFATMALDGPTGPAEARPSTDVSSNPLTLDYLQRAVVSAADHGGGWVQVVLHHICSTSDPGFTTCMTGEAAVEEGVFAAFLDWLRDDAPEGTTVRTVRQVMSGDR